MAEEDGRVQPHVVIMMLKKIKALETRMTYQIGKLVKVAQEDKKEEKGIENGALCRLSHH